MFRVRKRLFLNNSDLFVILNNLYFNQSLYEAIKALRVHHQLAPMYIEHEATYDQGVLRELERRHHALKTSSIESGLTAVTAVARDANSKISAVYDPRRDGSFAIIE